MTSTPEFNTSAADFSAEVTAADARVEQNPADLSPFERLHDKILARRTQQGEKIISEPSHATTLHRITEIAGRLQAVAGEAGETPTAEHLKKLAENMDEMEDEIDKNVFGIRRIQRNLGICMELNGTISADFEVLNSAVKKLATRYADDPRANQALLRALTGDVAETSNHIVWQGELLEAMISTAGENLEKASALQTSAQASRERMKDAAQAAQAVKEFVECCAIGTKTHVTVTKPLQFKPK